MKWIMNILIVLSAIFRASIADGTEYTLLKSGAWQGLISAGAGIQTKHFSFEGSVGYTPVHIAGKKIIQGNIQYNVWLGDHIYSIGGLMFTKSADGTYYKLPKRYPAKYYPPTALYFTTGMGVQFDSGFFVEMTTLDYLLELKFRNWEYVSWVDVISSGFGYRHTLGE